MAKKTAGRNELAPATKQGPEFLGKASEADAATEAAMQQRTQQLVEQFGDGLPWHPDHYEAAIRGELRRGCEAFLRAGSYLIVARECAAHGEWQGILGRLGLGRDQASRMMEASRRVRALPNVARAQHLIESAGSQSKLIELLSLPEDQFAELAEKGQSGDLSLDDIETMSRDELRAQVRELRADKEAKDARISKLSDDLNKEHEKVTKAQRKWKSATPDEQQLVLEHSVNDATAAVIADLGTAKAGLRSAVLALTEHCEKNELDCAEFLGDVFGRLLNAVRTVRDDDSYAIAIPVVADVEE